jgi:hypothetical protein
VEPTFKWKLLHAGGHTEGGFQFRGNALVGARINTTMCKFNSTPVYVANVVAQSQNWSYTGSHVLNNSTESYFDIVIAANSVTGKELLALSLGWKVSWIGGLGSNTGSTTPGRTEWSLDEGNIGSADFGAAYVDVDTANCNFQTTPQYFTALSGDVQLEKSGAVLTIMSTQMVYYSKMKSFRTYVSERTTTSKHNIGPVHLTPSFMNLHRWSIAWIGIEHMGPPIAPSPQWSIGSSTARWQQHGHSHIYMDVQLTHHTMSKAQLPGYITQVSAEREHWTVGGGGSVYGQSNNGFRLYLKGKEKDATVAAKVANHLKFKVNYVSFPANWEMPCILDEWGYWSSCSLACGGGQQIRSRKILQPRSDPFGWGQKSCPVSNETRICNTQTCGTNSCINSACLF